VSEWSDLSTRELDVQVNSVSADVVGDIIENDYELRLFLLFFPANMAIILDILTLHDKHNICT
jgi:hypothetical protein